MCDNDPWFNQEPHKGYSSDYSPFSFDEWYHEPTTSLYEQCTKDDTYKVNGCMQMKYSQQELEYLIERHGIWLKNRSQGKKLNLTYADLRGFNFQQADLRYSALHNCGLAGADFSGVNFQGVFLYNCDARDIKAVNTDFSHSNLRGTDFFGAKLIGANFSGAEISFAKNLILV